MTDPRLLIDKMNLDDELVNNPSLVQQVCDEAAEAIAYRDAMREALDAVDAELDAEIRELTSRNKMTEAAIKTTIQLRQEHKDAFRISNQAKLKAAKATSLVSAVIARGEAIKELSKLHVSGYYAIDSTKRSSGAQEAQYNK